MRIQPGCFPVGREIHTVQTTKTNERTNERRQTAVPVTSIRRAWDTQPSSVHDSVYQNHNSRRSHSLRTPDSVASTTLRAQHCPRPGQSPTGTERKVAGTS